MASAPSPSLALRQALIRGHLAHAEQLAQATVGNSSGLTNAAAAKAALEAIGPLIDGIGKALSGEHLSAIRCFEAAEALGALDVSLRLVCHVWLSRANLAMPDGLARASKHAECAVGWAAQLDPEARCVSTLLLAEIAYRQRDHAKAIALARSARPLLEPSKAPEVAEAWLLEARALGALGRESESTFAARRAHETRPSWPPPVTYLTRSAVRAGRLDEADRLLAPLMGKRTVPPEAARNRRLLDHVRQGVFPATTMYEFLVLVEEPPTLTAISALRALVTSHPAIAEFRDALGWKLLRAGNADDAAPLFEHLVEDGDLPSDLHASVLLALGFVATRRSCNTQPADRLHATVGATAASRTGNTEPPLPWDGSIHRSDPSEMLSPRTLSEAPPTEGDSDAPGLPSVFGQLAGVLFAGFT